VFGWFRDRRDRHRSKSRDGSSRGDKSVTIQTPGEPLLDAESTRGDERVSGAASTPLHVYFNYFIHFVVFTFLLKWLLRLFEFFYNFREYLNFSRNYDCFSFIYIYIYLIITYIFLDTIFFIFIYFYFEWFSFRICSIIFIN